MTIDRPTNGAAVDTPVEVQITKTGNVSMGDSMLDSFNMTQINGSNFQVIPGKLYWVPSGQHTLYVGATNSKTHQNIGESVTFSVLSCPLCYNSCPAGGTVHPATGQCCDSNGRCDEPAFGNFSVPFYGSPQCNQQTAPTTNPKYWYEFDCIRSDGEAIRGGTSARMVAVRFTSARSGQLAHIRVPIGVTSGPATARVWIAADANNSPGTALELITVTSVRAQPAPTTVSTPEHIYSAMRPALTAGTTYWLVIGPGDPSTQLMWNHTMYQADSSIPNTTTLLVTNTNNLTGPWVPKSNLAELRPAFQVDVR